MIHHVSGFGEAPGVTKLPAGTINLCTINGENPLGTELTTDSILLLAKAKGAPTSGIQCRQGTKTDGKPCPSGFHEEKVDSSPYCFANSSKTVLYVGIGAGVLILAGVIYAMTRHG